MHADLQHGQERVLRVRATWDPEAGVWVAESDDVPGLITESPSLDQLIEKLKTLIPELLELNHGDDEGEVPFEVLAQQVSQHRAR